MHSPGEFKLEQLGRILVVEPGRLIRTLAGNLSESQQRLLQEVEDSLAEAVIVDLHNVEVLGSVFIGILRNAWRLLRARSARLLLCELSPQTCEVLKVAKLDKVWPIYSTRQQAVDAQQQVERMRASVGDTVSMFLPKPTDCPSRLRILERGYRTVVGFDGGEFPPEQSLGRYLSDIQEVVDDCGCRDLRFDMTGVGRIPSGFLGVIATLSKRDVHVSVCHASPEVREIVELANFSHCLRSGSATSAPLPPAASSGGKTMPEQPENLAKCDWMGTLFSIERAPNTLIVSLGINGTYRSAQLHAEAAALERKLDDPLVRHLVIDLRGTNTVGSEVIGVLVSLANKIKEGGGKAAICRVSMHLHDMLTSVGLLKTWPHCPTREAAVILVNRR